MGARDAADRRAQLQLGWPRQVEFELTSVVAGEGNVNDAMVFMGAHEEGRHGTHGQTFRLIVPAAGSLQEEPEEPSRG